jgi:spore maturation protein CgeB
LLEHLIGTASVNLVIHGAQWEKLPRASRLRKCLRSKDLRFDDLAKAIRGADVVLGFLRKENRDDYTQRTFEIPACGGVLLAERTSRHLGYYREGLEAEFFDPNSPAELHEKVSKLLENPGCRARIRQAGHDAVLRGRHTYQDRLERLLWVYENQVITRYQ